MHDATNALVQVLHSPGQFNLLGWPARRRRGQGIEGIGLAVRGLLVYYATRVGNLLAANGVLLLDATVVVGNGGRNAFIGNGGWRCCIPTVWTTSASSTRACSR